MELTLKGDYYEWYCDWCDTRNLTLSFRVHDGTFACCACHRSTNYELAPITAAARQFHDIQATAMG